MNYWKSGGEVLPEKISLVIVCWLRNMAAYFEALDHCLTIAQQLLAGNGNKLLFRYVLSKKGFCGGTSILTYSFLS